MPQPGGNRVGLTTEQIDLFKGFADAPDKCAEGEPTPENATITTPDGYSSDDEEQSSQNLEKLFATSGCQDGPTVNTDANWALMQPLLAEDPNATSAFYDYGARAYVEGATKAPYDCNYDNFVASLGDLQGLEPTLREYEKYGWKLLQCAVVNGMPRVSLATLSTTINTLGDTILGINYKTVTIEDGGAP
jgi:hypothetical protein